MTDHRRLQRTLFRMQHDEGFAARIRSGEPGATASTGLGPGDLDLLLQASAAAVEADAGGRRRAQFLRNVAGEHALTVARALSGSDAALLESFPSSDEFHEAVVRDRSLPLAFARHARRRADASGDALLGVLAVLEEAMARARRGPSSRPAPPRGGLVLAAHADVLELPGGAVAAAAALREALDAGHALPDPPLSPDEPEHALVLGARERSPHRLGDATIETLSPLAGALLLAARHAIASQALLEFRRAHDVEDGELEDFLASLAADGVIVRD